VRSLNTAEPATKALAPARATSGATAGVIPPSISMILYAMSAQVSAIKLFTAAVADAVIDGKRSAEERAKGQEDLAPAEDLGAAAEPPPQQV